LQTHPGFPMKLVTFDAGAGELRPGILDGELVIDLVASDPGVPNSVRGILAANALGRIAEISQSSSAVRVANPPLMAPVVDPQKIIGVGLNYRDHALETGMEIPSEPIIFSKFPSSLIGPNADIRLPPISSQVDYEAELVVVIGSRAKNIAETESFKYLAGFTIGNEVSARDWQLKKPGGQWLLGKSFDTFSATGPALVTKDELPNPGALSIGMKLNGETVQNSSTSQLIFGIEKLVAYLSQVCTLEPGDLIFTGTPPGVGMARKPPVFLRPGDVCEAHVELLGVLQNKCVSA
jgi:2-keto-4-pentenoate hydratase/2-oxohepta-3-ene-1,7-dioic acid hydratase in catechol pathway